MTYQGHIENGTVVLDAPAKLPDGAKVEVLIHELCPPTSDLVEPEEREIPTLYERLKSVIGIADDLPRDFAENHDHYAHGRPKR